MGPAYLEFLKLNWAGFYKFRYEHDSSMTPEPAPPPSPSPVFLCIDHSCSFHVRT